MFAPHTSSSSSERSSRFVYDSYLLTYCGVLCVCLSLSLSYDVFSRIKKSVGGVEKKVEEAHEDVAAAAEQTESPVTKGFDGKLTALKSAHDSGLINRRDYEAAKKAVIGQFLNQGL